MSGHEGAIDRGDLLALLRGEFGAEEVFHLRDHLAGCATCREELAEVATGHSLLASARRTLREPALATEPPAPSAPVPDVQQESRRRRRRVLQAVGAVAAALVLVGGGATLTLLDDATDPSGGPTAAPPAQEADLEAVGSSPGRGVVTMAEGDADEEAATMTIETHELPAPSAGEYYYVWLLDPDTNKMLPIGQVASEGSTTFRLPLSLLGRYSAIDVSLETDDGDPGHSPTSVLRAQYAPPDSTDS
jgi:hypothetical protein